MDNITIKVISTEFNEDNQVLVKLSVLYPDTQHDLSLNMEIIGDDDEYAVYNNDPEALQLPENVSVDTALEFLFGNITVDKLVGAVAKIDLTDGQPLTHKNVKSKLRLFVIK